MLAALTAMYTKAAMCVWLSLEHTQSLSHAIDYLQLSPQSKSLSSSSLHPVWHSPKSSQPQPS